MLPTRLSILINEMLRIGPVDLLTLMDKMLHVDLIRNKTVPSS